MFIYKGKLKNGIIDVLDNIFKIFCFVQILGIKNLNLIKKILKNVFKHKEKIRKTKYLLKNEIFRKILEKMFKIS